MKFNKYMSFAAAIALMSVAFLNPTPVQAQAGPGGTTLSLDPTQQVNAATLAATGDYYFDLSYAAASGAVRASALSGTLVATIQGSNDDLSVADGSAAWSTLYYLDATAPSTPANSITANGLYVFNTAGFTRFRVHVTTLSGGSHVVTLRGTANVGAGPVYTLGAAIPAGSATIGNVGSVSDYPVGATPLTATATGTTAATTATLAGTTGKTTYLCGFSINTSATAAVVVAPTVTGGISGTMTFSQYVPANTAGVSELAKSFPKCIPASATNTGIAVVSGAASTGGVTAVNAWGYQL